MLISNTNPCQKDVNHFHTNTSTKPPESLKHASEPYWNAFPSKNVIGSLILDPVAGSTPLTLNYPDDALAVLSVPNCNQKSGNPNNRDSLKIHQNAWIILKIIRGNTLDAFQKQIMKYDKHTNDSQQFSADDSPDPDPFEKRKFLTKPLIVTI